MTLPIKCAHPLQPVLVRTTFDVLFSRQSVDRWADVPIPGECAQMGKPNLRRPVTGPYRQSRWAGALEVAFGWVAKGTMVLVGLGMVALAA